MQRLAATPIDRAKWSEDARRYDGGEFFYEAANTGADGFFFLTVPRGRTLKLAARALGYRDVDETRDSASGVYQDLGTIVMLAPLRLPDLSKPYTPPWHPQPQPLDPVWRRWLPPPPTGLPPGG